MIRVQAPSRLHFGLLSIPAGTHWPNRHGEETLPARRFGGVGLMIESPGVRLTVQPAPEWAATGPLGERALGYARRFVQTVPAEVVQPQRLEIEASAPEHAGLGSGTQLGLAVARALAAAFGMANLGTVELARRIGRGRRSALGIYGFERGGFLVEGGKLQPDTIAPLLAHVPFPEAWQVVLALPQGEQGLHGPEESRAFQCLYERGASPTVTDALCRLVLLGMLPALAEQDLNAFGEAVYDFNARVGEVFAPVQGGTYASPRLAELVSFVRQQGVRGVGQSSWGPAVFAVTADAEQAEDLVQRLRTRFQLPSTEAFRTGGSRCGAACELA